MAPNRPFVARTRLGPFGFDDPMVVRSLVRTDDGGGRVVIDKTGALVRGRVVAQVRADGTGAMVRWEQQIAVWRLPPLLDPVVAAVARLAYRSALRRIID